MPPLLRRSKHLHLNLREFNAEGRGCLRVVIHGAVDLIQTVHRSMVAGGDGHDAGASDAAGGEVLALAQQNSEGGMCETRHMSHIHVTCPTFTSRVAPVTPRCGLAVLVGELVCASLPSARTRYRHQQQQQRRRQQQQQHRHHHIHRSHSPPVTGTIVQLPLHETMQNPAPLPLDVRGLGLYS